MEYMEIKLAEQTDLVEILELQYLSYRSEAEIYNDSNIKPLTQTIYDIEQEFTNHTILKAVIDHRIVGSVRAYEVDGTCKIGKLIVHPGYQNQGVGTKLMIRIEQLFEDVKRFELFTGNKSIKNLYLYEKLGYKIYNSEVLNNSISMIYLEKM